MRGTKAKAIRKRVFAMGPFKPLYYRVNLKGTIRLGEDTYRGFYQKMKRGK